MHVAIFCPFVQWPTHFGTDLELIQRHLDCGDQVTVIVCDGEMPTCEVNIDHSPDVCAGCIRSRHAGLALLTPRATVVSLHQFIPADAMQFEIPERFTSHEQLKRYRIDGFDLGYAALSSLIFLLRDGGCDLAQHGARVNGLLRAAHRVYRATREFLQRHAVDRFYVFNGRFATTRGVMRACADAGVECLMHERGCDLRHFELYPNVFPHDRAFIDRTIRRLWEEAGPASDRATIGAQWFRNKVQGIEPWEVSFVAHQEPEQLPSPWRNGTRKVAIFTSSEDEFAAIGPEWQNPLYEHELAGVEAIVDSLRHVDHETHLYVRIHPNLRGLDNRQTQGLRALSAPFLTVIPADSLVSSYSLLRNADTVLTFGSTIGIEAVYWGVPSILAGVSYYRGLDATYTPTTHEELMRQLRAPLAPLPVEPALMYGFYASTYGSPFRYFRAASYDVGSFKGHDWWRQADSPDTR